jgi:aspartyl-tRNA synthetase
MREAIILRHRVVKAIRDYLSGVDFLDIETPLLTRSTPEGARDFLVPARVSPGAFYALPQSPQMFKQLLMMAGFERYYQIARCFRDEDLRADRQPEFTQLDLEMSFCEEEDVIGVIEGMMAAVFAAVGFDAPAPPYPRISYDESMLRYGNDRPDRRFGLEIADLGDIFSKTGFKVFSNALERDGVIRGINAGQRTLARSELDDLTEFVQRHGAGGLVWCFIEENEWRSPIAKFLSDEERAEVQKRLDAKTGDLIFIVADNTDVACAALSNLRLELARRFELIPEGKHELLWVVDWPMFEWNEDQGRWDALHHPFTSPRGDLKDPGQTRSRAYDIIFDGLEVGGGSIRINTIETQQKVFELLGIEAEEAKARFGFLLEALQYGAPPHGGIALGIDRLVAQIAGYESIREVIAFPKTASGSDPLTGAPAEVERGQLTELGIRLA